MSVLSSTVNFKKEVKAKSLINVEVETEDSSRYQCHGLFPYPAMMVPRLQGKLIDELLGRDSIGMSIFDPFMGSGTVLSESLARGVNFYGTDINPLSLLCCEVKSDTFDLNIAVKALSTLESRLHNKSFNEKLHFLGSDKWFDNSINNTLTFIRNEVMQIEPKWCRRIFWLSLAETVRRFSKTRLSTYKLHIDKEQKTAASFEVVNFFIKISQRNIKLKDESWNSLKSNGLIAGNSTASKVHLELSDARCLKSPFEVDLIVTSPPYGDNQTTVTYGQFSFLPLQFINLDDITYSFDRSLINNASSIDSASLGGSLRNWRDKMAHIEPLSISLSLTLRELTSISRGGEKRLASFIFDLNESLISISQKLKPNGHAMITLGNRKINGVSVPLNDIVSQLLSSLGFRTLKTFNRKIMKKRMAGSMSSEKILIMKKEN